jgi:hypothetical protein
LIVIAPLEAATVGAGLLVWVVVATDGALVALGAVAGAGCGNAGAGVDPVVPEQATEVMSRMTAHDFLRSTFKIISSLNFIFSNP